MGRLAAEETVRPLADLPISTTFMVGDGIPRALWGTARGTTLPLPTDPTRHQYAARGMRLLPWLYSADDNQCKTPPAAVFFLDEQHRRSSGRLTGLDLAF